MPIHPEWSDLAVRLLCASLAGLVIGFDRGEHARPAGLRTTMLVCLAACVSMIQANLLLAQAGKPSDSFVVLDLMRLPLGILSGMGFIGAGAIMRRDNLVLGVTTAATLWFVTVIGLCFGGGQIALGFAGLAIGFFVLAGLRYLEPLIRQDREGTLVVVLTRIGPTESEIQGSLAAEQYRVRGCSVIYNIPDGTHEWTCQVSWRSRDFGVRLPEFVRTLSRHPGVARVAWSPQTR
jgi:putative Mg2+ transporter-C (MgtC) family protein